MLPSRVAGQTPRFLTRHPTLRLIVVGSAVLLAGAVTLAALLAVPRPNIQLTNPHYFPSACDTANHTRIVTATFTLTNQGRGTGVMQVDLYADGTQLTSDAVFEVPAMSSVRGTLSGVVHDCAAHAYSLSAFYPPSSS